MRYVVLLRGVNVGGGRRVPKLEVLQVLESRSFDDVSTYINSGNAVFTADNDVDTAMVQSALEEHFGFDIPTLVLPGDKIKMIAEAIPPEWTNDTPKPDKSGQKSDVLYLFDEANSPSILENIGHNPEIETMKYVDGAVIVNISRANQSRGSLDRLIGTKLYKQVTIRNVNTARKLAELVG